METRWTKYIILLLGIRMYLNAGEQQAKEIKGVRHTDHLVIQVEELRQLHPVIIRCMQMVVLSTQSFVCYFPACRI